MTDTDIIRATGLLGLRPADFLAMRESGESLGRLKAKAKRGYRAAAMRLHPDRTGGDVAKAEDFKLVSAFMQEVEALPLLKTRKRVTHRLKVTVRVQASPR